MPIQQLPLMKGTGKDYRNADYIDYLPVNMLATPKEVLNSNGYLRSFPGIGKLSDVNGASRGAEFNTAQNAVYRVMGGKLYKGDDEVGGVEGVDRVPMAHGRTSQAVCVNGQIIEYRYDGTTKVISNWPVGSGYTQYEIGSARDLTRLRGRYAWTKDGTDSWFITDLKDESHPDRNSAEYRAESQPDGIIGIGTWRDFVVCFGTTTTEFFSLTGASTAGAALYVANPAYMVPKGIAGTFCKCVYMDSYAILSNPAANLDTRVTANTAAIGLLEVRLTTAEGKIVVLRSDVDYLLDEVVDITASIVSLDGRVTTAETNISTIQSNYVSKSATSLQSITSPVGITTSLSVNGVKVLGPRQTGWTASTGTPYRGAFTSEGAMTVGATYSQTEVKAIADALRACLRRFVALETDLRSHGVID